MRSRQASDEHYVLDVCDEILGCSGARQHTFNWLQGDTGRLLPVDSFYEELELVVEYREGQHESSGPPHWNRLTTSGVRRDEQRRLYDRRREVEIAAHDLRLLILTPGQMDATKRGRLRRRDRASDVEKLRAILEAFGLSVDRERGT